VVITHWLVKFCVMTKKRQHNIVLLKCKVALNGKSDYYRWLIIQEIPKKQNPQIVEQQLFLIFFLCQGIPMGY